MDQLDLSILATLQKDGRRPFTDIAQELGVSEGTVRNRVSKLIENNILHIVGLVDPGSLGFNAPAVIGVSLNEGDIEQIASEIGAQPEVNYLIMVSGEFDLIVEVLCKNREHLANFINYKLRRVDGVERTQTFMTLRTFKMSYGAPPIVPELYISKKRLIHKLWFAIYQIFSKSGRKLECDLPDYAIII